MRSSGKGSRRAQGRTRMFQNPARWSETHEEGHLSSISSWADALERKCDELVPDRHRNFVDDALSVVLEHRVELTRKTIEEAASIIDRAWKRKRLEQRALGALDLWAALLPTRVVNEEIGDCIEDINRRVSAGQGRIRVGLRVCAAIFWTGVNAIGYLRKQIGTKRGA